MLTLGCLLELFLNKQQEQVRLIYRLVFQMALGCEMKPVFVRRAVLGLHSEVTLCSAGTVLFDSGFCSSFTTIQPCFHLLSVPLKDAVFTPKFNVSDSVSESGIRV